MTKQHLYYVDSFQAADQSVWNKHWIGYMGSHHPPALHPAVLDMNWKTIMAKDGRLLAWALRDAAGCCQGFAHITTQYSTEAGFDEAYLMDLYIDPDHRGRGAGHLLMQHILEDCRSKALYRLFWITVPGVEYNRRFYEKYAQGRSWDRYFVYTNEPQDGSSNP